MANITGDYPQIDRVDTGGWSLNRAFGGGWPMTTVELTGFAGVFKTTFATSVLARIAEHYGKKFLYAPIEPADRKQMNSILDSVGFTKEAHIITEQTDEEMVDKFCELLGDDEYASGLFDSLTAISPIMEMESSSADMNMGRRARLTGVLARKLVHLNRFRSSPVTSILISHITQSMSPTPTNTGSSTSGGEVKKNLSKVRIKARKMPENTMSDLDKNAFVMEGFVEKYNFGKDRMKFYAAILGGKGMHIGLTAMYDCKMLGLCTFGKSITMGGIKYGAMRTIVAKAHENDDEFFQPFISALQNPSSVGKAAVEEDDNFIYDDVAK